jgi:hypothetical protein
MIGNGWLARQGTQTSVTSRKQSRGTDRLQGGDDLRLQSTLLRLLLLAMFFATATASILRRAVAAPRFQRAGFIDVQRPPVQFLSIQALNDSLGFGVAGHFGEPKPARTIRVRVGLDFNGCTFSAERLKMGGESFLSRVEG